MGCESLYRSVAALAYGWFPPGWALGNAAIGAMCGKLYQRGKIARNIIITVIAVFLGVACIKTAVECMMFSIPLAVKFSKNFIAFVMDAATMSVGVIISERINKTDSAKTGGRRC